MKRMLGLTLLIAGLVSVGCKKEDAATDQPTTQEPSEPSAGKTTEDPAKAGEEPAKAGEEPGKAGEEPAAPVKTDTPEAKAARYIACNSMLIEKNVDGFKACLDDAIEVVQVDAVPKTELKGPDAFLGYLNMYLTAFPDIKSAPQIVLVNGDNVAAIVLTTGTNSADMGPMKATNKKYGQFEAHQVVLNADGKATKMAIWVDQSAMFHQLGIAENPNSPDAIDKPLVDAPQTTVAKNDDAEKANVDQVKKGLELITKKDAKAYGDLLADDVKFWVHGGKNSATDKASYEKGLKEHLGMMKEIKADKVDVWAAGDWVVAEVTGSASLAKDIPGAKGTKGKPMTGKELHFFQLAEGKIKQHHIFINSLSRAVELGLVKEEDLVKKMTGGAGAAAPAEGGAAPADDAKAAPADDAKKADKKGKKASKKDDEGGW